MQVPGMAAKFATVALMFLTTDAFAAQTNAPEAEKTAITVTEVAKGLEHPWGMQFLPGGGYLVTERSGTLRIIGADGKISEPVSGVPKVVAQGQGGLLDVLLAPDFATSGLIYLSYTEPREASPPQTGAKAIADGVKRMLPGSENVGLKNATTVARGKLALSGDAGTLSDVQVVFRQQPAFEGRHHYGSRLVWAKDGTLFITTGERSTHRDLAQDLKTHLGKVIRINADGSVPTDNPYIGNSAALPEIWSYGHRNLQGAALNPATGELWTTEHGARGGDELNIPRANKNYGWPIITWGIDYSGAKIGEGTTKEGLEQPVYYWKPSIATSGLAFYNADLFPSWKGNALAGGLAGAVLERLVLNGDEVVGVEHLLHDRGDRIRDVRVGPDGAVYVLTDDDDGKILKLTPAG